MRCLITDHNSLKPVVRTIVLLSLVVCAGMLIERRIEKNLFYVLGSHMDVTVREGEVRAAATFDNPIMAGTFGAIMFPLMWVLLQGDRRDKSALDSGDDEQCPDCCLLQVKRPAICIRRGCIRYRFVAV